MAFNVKSWVTAPFRAVGDFREQFRGVIALFLVSISATYLAIDFISGIIVPTLPEYPQFDVTLLSSDMDFILRASLFIGIVLVAPLLVYRYYAPSDTEPTDDQAKKALRMSLISIGLIIVGALTYYFVSLPVAMRFLSNLDTTSLQELFAASGYPSFAVTVMFFTLIAFLLPFLMVAALNTASFTVKALLRKEQYVIVGMFVLAFLFAPVHNVLTIVMLAAPGIIAYQIALIIAWRWPHTAEGKTIVREKKPEPKPEPKPAQRTRPVSQHANIMAEQLAAGSSAHQVRPAHSQQPVHRPVAANQPSHQQQRPMQRPVNHSPQPHHPPQQPRPHHVAQMHHSQHQPQQATAHYSQPQAARPVSRQHAPSMGAMGGMMAPRGAQPQPMARRPGPMQPQARPSGSRPVVTAGIGAPRRPAPSRRLVQ